MKNRILKELINKHKRTSLSLGIYQDELLKLGDANEVKKSIKELQKEKKIDSHTGIIGTLHKVSEKYLKTLLDKVMESKDFIPQAKTVCEIANAINIVQDELNLLNIHIVSTRTFNENCNVYVDTETDEWVFDYKGVTKKRAKSKFECLLTKKALQKELGV